MSNFSRQNCSEKQTYLSAHIIIQLLAAITSGLNANSLQDVHSVHLYKNANIHCGKCTRTCKRRIEKKNTNRCTPWESNRVHLLIPNILSNQIFQSKIKISSFERNCIDSRIYFVERNRNEPTTIYIRIFHTANAHIDEKR